MTISQILVGFEWLLNAMAFIIELVFCIPLLGRMAKWVWNLLLVLPGIISLMLDYGLSLAGIKLEKKMRVGVIVLNAPDRADVVMPANVMEGLAFAEGVFADQANVKLIPIAKTVTLAPGDTTPWLRYESQPSPATILDVHCNLTAMLEDLWLTGSYYEYYMATRWFESNFRRVSGIGAPLIVFVVRGIENFGGCSLGPLSDYVTVLPNRLICIAHELGHACNLPHTEAPNNVMDQANCEQVRLTAWQVAVLRASRHVSYF